METKPFKSPTRIPEGVKPADWKYSIRREVYIRDNFTCQDCNLEFDAPEHYSGRLNIEGLTLGHVIPRCLGGHFSPENLRAQCKPCNDKLGDRIWAKEVRRALTHYQLK